MAIKRANHFEFGFDHCAKVSFELYPDFEHDVMLLDPFTFEHDFFGSLIERMKQDLGISWADYCGQEESMVAVLIPRLYEEANMFTSWHPNYT